MLVVFGAGTACSIKNYGVPFFRLGAATSGSITTKPSHGSAEFIAPEAMYKPEPGYFGNDEFEYEALARGIFGQPVRLKVRVKVLMAIE